ncbi:MAG: multidrug efflux SMR transporter [Paracoccus sp. (in: a-proteobacteria)]|uniref:DMT family transporter n=1 Tax=Paracoccus sp. TaxID=267 RepID=UPI0026DF24E7|nr:multidrug efflux SMR transporter [Paracoccus sp. (in: a-proteobacteria)]MDO5612202.1 multidrug efflux SMR transporter [Paracoccus sp. (in: a-proteobacteria)]
MPGILTYGILAAAIVSEIFATSMLQRSEQFTRLLPTVLMGLGYALSFYLLSHVLRVIPLGVAYAIWSGLGVICVALIGRFVFGQQIDTAGMIGITLIVAGVVVLNLFSGSATH